MTISIVNQKGGTGKTTSTVNLGRALAERGFRVLLIDLDPQANLSYSLAINQFDYSISDVLMNEIRYSDSLISRESMDIIPTGTELSELEFNGSGKDAAYLLKEALKSTDDYDFTLIDCPPSMSLLTTNSLAASHYVLVPIQLDVFSIQGLRHIINSIEKIRNLYNDQLEILGILPVMVDKRKRLTAEVLDYVKENFEVYVFEKYIRTNVKAAEAPSFGRSVIDYAPLSNSARDYQEAADELIEQTKLMELNH